MHKNTEKHTCHALSLENSECNKKDTIKVCAYPDFSHKVTDHIHCQYSSAGWQWLAHIVIIVPNNTPYHPVSNWRKHKNKN